VFFMFSHKISYLESHVTHVRVKTLCLDDNLVHLVHISVFETLSLEYCYEVGQEMLS
jgi:hypothetical protein